MIYIFQVLLMAILHILAYQTWYLFLDGLKEVLIKYLIGFKKNSYSEEKVKVLGIYADKQTDFDYHISQLWKNAGKK